MFLHLITLQLQHPRFDQHTQLASMDMSMSTDMGARATDTGSMATTTPMSTSTSDMSMMGMGSMEMAFFASTSTPLWSSHFTPRNVGQYAGICVFLVTFATIFRLFVALRVNVVTIFDAAERRQYGGLMQTYATELKSTVRPWRAREAVMTAALDVLLAGVSYLLWVWTISRDLDYLLILTQDACGDDVECWVLPVDTGWCFLGKHGLRSFDG
jgi:hypothetical protein